MPIIFACEQLVIIGFPSKLFFRLIFLSSAARLC